MSYSSNSMGNPFGGAPVYGYPGASPAQPPAPAKEHGARFVTLFIVLVILAVPGTWLIIPSLYIQVTGHATQGKASIVADCGDDDGSEDYQATILFKDSQGQLFEIPPNNTCTNFINDGDSLALWYLPDNPSSTFVLSGIAFFFYIMCGFWLLVTLPCLFFFLRATLALLRTSVQAGVFFRLWRPALICLIVLTPLLVFIHFFPPGQASGPSRNYHLGETVAVDGRWAVTVQGGQPVQEGVNPQDGYVCVELDITLRNLTNQALSLDEGQFALYDTHEQTLDNTCSLRATTLNTSSLAPGDTFAGAIAYQVPIGASQFYLAFQPDPDNALSVARSFWQVQVTQGASNQVYTA
ncbi:MAG TPA: DUF4352 domain-containing protein [Ktedonobacterales bacterium]|nr:DUF4352 domain-containing protein [Ktedonobacterales bacterium]